MIKERKKIFAFEDSISNVAAYEKLGFNISIDDAANGIYYISADLTNYDWLAVLALLEDCQRENLQPSFKYDGGFIDWKEAIELADKKANAKLSVNQ